MKVITRNLHILYRALSLHHFERDETLRANYEALEGLCERGLEHAQEVE